MNKGPFFSIMELSSFNDGRVYFKHLGMKVYLKDIIIPILKWTYPCWNSLHLIFRGEGLEKL